jgi:putative urate catabolism protein
MRTCLTPFIRTKSVMPLSAPSSYPRDLLGYGRTPPHPHWPGKARIALQFVLNYEEGAENAVLHGDAGSETFLSEIIGAQAFPMRHMSMESLYEYGSRAGLWRVLRLFEDRGLPLTIFAVSMALQRNPEALAAFVSLGHEIACHGLRWISYQHTDEAMERAHMQEAVAIIKSMTGSAPLGWYTGRDSPNTRKLVVEHGGFRYDSDYYGDDLPFWETVDVADVTSEGSAGTTATIAKPHLVVPYTLDTNDMRFAAAQGFNSGTQFFDYLKDAFDVLYAEGDPSGLNQPQSHQDVWITRRIDIAEHWHKHHPHHPRHPSAGGAHACAT